MTNEEAILILQMWWNWHNGKMPVYPVPTEKFNEAQEMAIEALKEKRPHGEWISKPKRIQVDETDEERIFETRQEWFCSSCGKSFGLRKPEDAFCKYCGSDNRPKEGE